MKSNNMRGASFLMVSFLLASLTAAAQAFLLPPTNNIIVLRHHRNSNNRSSSLSSTKAPPNNSITDETSHLNTYPSIPPDLEGIFTDREWEQRCSLAVSYRIAFLHDWHENVFNHVTLKVDGSEIVEVEVLDPSVDFLFWHVRHRQYALLGPK